jgi:cytochrome P450
MSTLEHGTSGSWKSGQPRHDDEERAMDRRPPAFPFSTPDPLEPPAEYAKLRASAPVSLVTLPSGDPAWLVTRYEDVRRVLTDPRFSREAITAPGAPQVMPIARGVRSIVVMDRPEHTRLRGLISKAFSPRRIEAMRPRIQEITDGLLDAMVEAGPPADLMSGLALPLPIRVICELLGVPYEDVPGFRAWTDLMLNYATENHESVLEGMKRLNAYLTELIEKKREAPEDDLLSALILVRDEEDRLSEEDLLAFGYTLLGAGYHTTTSAIAYSVLLLLRAPGRLRSLRDDPALLPTAVEEILRCSQAASGIGGLRIAVEDVELGGQLIRSGDPVMPSVNSANRDESVFPAADVLDLGRSPNPHIAFGYGMHHCIGASLSRTELQIALGSLLRRFDDLDLAVPAADLQWNLQATFRRPRELPIRWS